MTDEIIKKMHNVFKTIFKVIKENNCFIIYRHESPDFDALGAQLGLATWIKDNFPDKEVHYIGDDNPNLIPSLFPQMEKVSENLFQKEHVAIVVDVSNSQRISLNHLAMAKTVIKIDHHNFPTPENDYGDIKAVFPTRPAASEIIALFALSRPRKYHLSIEAASFLYIGIVGDTSRFLYQDTDSATLRIAADLLEIGIDKSSIYRKMYKTDKRKLAILQYCLTNYQMTPNGIAYYVLDKTALDNLHMTTAEGNLHINTFRDLSGVKAVISVTYDNERNDYRVSIRSPELVVDKVAQQFGGGGHDFAAGCRLTSLEQLPILLKALDELAS